MEYRNSRVLCGLTKNSITTEKYTNFVNNTKCGAVSLFLGTTRDNFDGKKVSKLEYEAYESMAINILKNLAEQIILLDSEAKVAIVHRIGIVPVSEISLCIAVSSPHRELCLNSVSKLVDKIKATVPIWKKEVYSDGSTNWKENKECFWQSHI